MKFTVGSRFSLYTSIVLTIIISLFLVWNSAKIWLAYTYASDPPPDGLKHAITVVDDDSQLYFLLGQYYDNYAYSAPHDQIYKLYKKALELNPLNYNYWYYLAEFLSYEGRPDMALFALNQATGSSPGVVALRWKAGMLASKLGDEKALLDNLSSVIANDRNRRLKAFILLWQSIRNGNKIQLIIPNSALHDYLHYLISTKRLPEAEFIFNRMISSNTEIKRNLLLRYVDFLIDEHDIDGAKKAWVHQFSNWKGVWNGNFENEIMNGGFDWRTDNVEGSLITIEYDQKNNGHSIKIEFNGTKNLDFHHFDQIVPVDENSQYKLSSIIKSNDLSSGNGLFWEVACPENNKYLAKTEQVLGTTDWHSTATSFEVPEGCNFITIKLRRYKDNIFDSKISGTVWIDNVSLEKVH